MMTKLISTILLTLLPFQMVMAETPQITPLNQGQEAPYSGVLYNTTAIAEIIAQREALIKQHAVFIKQLEEQMKANCDLQLGNLSAELDVCNDKYDYMTGIKDKQIIRLEELALDNNEHTIWWFGGGVLLGIITTIGITYAVNK
jgi:hypothetical protein